IDAVSIEVSGQTTTNFSNIAALTLNTGLGEDQVTLVNTFAGVTNVRTDDDNDTVTIKGTGGPVNIVAGAGDDTIKVQAIGSETNITAGAGNDTINVGSAAPGTNGTLNGIAALLRVSGSFDGDTLNIDSTGDLGPDSGDLTNASLTGLGMAG